MQKKSLEEKVLLEACLREVWPREHNFVQVYRKLCLECNIRDLEELKTSCTTKIANDQKDQEERFIPVINMLIRKRSTSKVEIGEESVNALVKAVKEVSLFMERRKQRNAQDIYVSNLPGEALEMFWFCNELVQENKMLSVGWRNTAVYLLVEDLRIRSRMSLWRALTSREDKDGSVQQSSLFERFDSRVMNLFLTKLRVKKPSTNTTSKDSTSFLNGNVDTTPGIATTRLLVAAESVMNEIKYHGARTKYVNRDTESEGRNRFCTEFGQYFCDCSGFVCALLKQTLDMEISGFHSDRPYLRARDFSYFFASKQNVENRSSLHRGAWRRVSNLDRAQVGDFVSWLYVGHTNKPIRSAYIDHKESLDSVLRQVGYCVRYAARQREGLLLLPHRVRKESHVWVRKMTQILEEELDIDGYWDFVERLEKDPDGLLRDLRRHDTDQVLIDNDTLKMLKEASSDRTYSSTGHIVIVRSPPRICKHDDAEPRHRFTYEFEGKVYERIAIATMETYESNAPDGVTTRNRVFWQCRRVSDGYTVWFPKKSLFRAQPRHVGIQIEIGRMCL